MRTLGVRQVVSEQAGNPDIYRVFLRVYRFCIGFVTKYGLGAITLVFFDILVSIMRFLVCTKSFDDNIGSTSGHK